MDKDSIRIMAWDPSLRNLGLGVGDSTSSGLNMVMCTTYYINKLVETHGLNVSWGEDENTQRLYMLEYVVERAILNYKPDLMVIESPVYNNLNPKTLMIQMLAITALQRLAHKHRVTFMDGISIYMPNQIKLAIGVPNTKEAFKDKMEVTKALLRLVESGELSLEEEEYAPSRIDEHANDAMAMVYTKHKELKDVFNE